MPLVPAQPRAAPRCTSPSPAWPRLRGGCRGSRSHRSSHESCAPAAKAPRAQTGPEQTRPVGSDCPVTEPSPPALWAVCPCCKPRRRQPRPRSPAPAPLPAVSQALSPAAPALSPMGTTALPRPERAAQCGHINSGETRCYVHQVL